MKSSTAEDRTEVVVIWNPGAGSAGEAEAMRSDLAARKGVKLIETRSRDDAIAQVERACREKIPRVIAAGGDGTVNAAVTALARWGSNHRQSPSLAILPLGTGNDLARTLQMPLDPRESLEICLAGEDRPVDVMELNSADGTSQIVGNMITAGNTGKYLDVLTDELKQRWGALCYLRGAVNVLEELEVYQVRLKVDDEPIRELAALNLFVANGRTSGGGMTVCADACVDDGLMDLVVIQEGTGLDLAGLTVDYLTSDLRDNDLVLHRRCQRVRVTCPVPIPLSADGDPARGAEFVVRLRQGAIRAVTGAE